MTTVLLTVGDTSWSSRTALYVLLDCLFALAPSSAGQLACFTNFAFRQQHNFLTSCTKMMSIYNVPTFHLFLWNIKVTCSTYGSMAKLSCNSLSSLWYDLHFTVLILPASPHRDVCLSVCISRGRPTIDTVRVLTHTAIAGGIVAVGHLTLCPTLNTHSLELTAGVLHRNNIP